MNEEIKAGLIEVIRATLQPLASPEKEAAYIGAAVMEYLAQRELLPCTQMKPESATVEYDELPPAPRPHEYLDQDRALRDFLVWCMRKGPWDGYDIDASEAQDKAEELGLIVKEEYDHTKHGGSYESGGNDLDEGDDWFVFAEGITDD